MSTSLTDRFVYELEDKLATEQIRLAACSTAALGNIPSSVAQRLTSDSPYYSASYQDVCNAVDREIALRDGRAAFMREFCGWLSADIPELHMIEASRLLESLERFLAR